MHLPTSSPAVHDQALADFIDAGRIQNAGPERLNAFRRSYELGGIKGYLRAWLKLQHDRIEAGRINPFNLARGYAFLGERDRALTLLEQAVTDHSLEVSALRGHPAFDDLRADNRYRLLLVRLRLEQ